MSSINYTVDANTIGEWKIRSEAPNFEDFPAPVPPFGVEARDAPAPPLPPPSRAPPAPLTPRKSRSALSALSSNLLLSPSPSKKQKHSPAPSSVAAPVFTAEQTFAGVWGDLVPFGVIDDMEWQEEKEKGEAAVKAGIVERIEESGRERKRKNNERAKARYATKKKAEKEKAEKAKEEEEIKKKQKKKRKSIKKGKGGK